MLPLFLVFWAFPALQVSHRGISIKGARIFTLQSSTNLTKYIITIISNK